MTGRHLEMAEVIWGRLRECIDVHLDNAADECESCHGKNGDPTERAHVLDGQIMCYQCCMDYLQQ